MTKMTKLEGPSYGPQGGGKPGHLVVLLHGYGADGNDLIGLAPVLAPLMPDVVFHAPNAPYPCEGNPVRLPVVRHLAPRSGARRWPACAARRRSSMPSSTRRWRSTGSTRARPRWSASRQGTMMALHVGLRRAKPLAGIVGFSGMLAGPEVLQDEIKSRPPVLLVHGDSDEMLPHHADRTRRRGAAAERRRSRPCTSPRASATASTRPACSHAARFLLEAFKLPMPQDRHDDRRHLQARLRARRRGLREELRRPRRGRRLGLPDRGRRDRGRSVGRRRRSQDRRAVDAGHGRASSSPAPRARRRSAPMCWRAAASSTSMRRSPSCGRSSASTARSA